MWGAAGVFHWQMDVSSPADGYTLLEGCPSAWKSNLQGIWALIPIQESEANFPLNSTDLDRALITEKGSGTVNSIGNGNSYKYMNNLWKMQNSPTICANNSDAAVGINFVITYQKKGRESNAFNTIFY